MSLYIADCMNEIILWDYVITQYSMAILIDFDLNHKQLGQNVSLDALYLSDYLKLAILFLNYSYF